MDLEWYYIRIAYRRLVNELLDRGFTREQIKLVVEVIHTTCTRCWKNDWTCKCKEDK